MHLIVPEISWMNTWRYRRKELRQLALQASSVEELLEVVETTVTVMRKHWSEAISTFEDKFRSLSTLLLEHGKVHHPRYILRTSLRLVATSELNNLNWRIIQ